LQAIANITQKIQGSAMLFVDAIQKLGFPKVLADKDAEIATLADTFWNTTTQGKAFSCAIGIPLENSAMALELLKEIITETVAIASVFSMRFVKGSAGLMAFTKFPTTCILELDGVRNKDNENFIKLIPPKLRANNIPFTFHWGKDNPMNKTMVKEMYGNNLKQWVAQRSRLLAPQEAEVFRSIYTDGLGLGDYDQSAIPIVT
jgi:hypothetical protein